VLGSTPAANAGTLPLLAGGSKELVDSIKDVLSVMGTLRFISEDIGPASVLKLSLNNLVLAQVSAISFSLAMVKSGNLPLDIFWNVMKESPVYSKYFDFKYKRLTTGDYSDPEWSTELLLKDANLIIEEAQQLHLNAASVTGMRDLASATVANGFGQDDIAALIEGALGTKKS